MKILKRIRVFCLLLLIAGSFAGSGKVMTQPGATVSFQTFYDDLSPYGRWMDYNGYGRVWIPAVERDFQPYGTRGHWVVTDYGNTWVSDYDWGWAPFHYGRWIYDDYYGWMWVPGSEWGPAWVTWRSGGGYYGWAPLSPGVDISINIDIPLLRWIFVPQQYITSIGVYSFCVPRNRSVNIYRSTTIINDIYVSHNRRYFYGPRPQEIERVTRNRVVIHHIDYMDRPGRAIANNGSLRIYRPHISDNGRPRPGYNNNNSRPGNFSYGRDHQRPENANPSRGNDNRPGNMPSRTGDPRPDRGQGSAAPGNVNERPDRNSTPVSTPDRNNQNMNRDEQRRSRESQRREYPSADNQQNNGAGQSEERTPPRQYRPSSSQGNNRPEEQRQQPAPDVQRQPQPERTRQVPATENRSREESQQSRQAPEQRTQRPERTSQSSSTESRRTDSRDNSSHERPSGDNGRRSRR